MSEIVQIILRAIQSKRDPEIYGSSHALKMNTQIAEKAAAEIAALPRSSAATEEGPAAWEQVGWIRDYDRDGEEITEICSQDDPGAYPVYRGVRHTQPQQSSGTASDVEQVFTSICDELGCAYDNESALMAIDNLKRRASGFTDEPQPTPEQVKDADFLAEYNSLAKANQAISLANKIDLHLTLSGASPGFHLSEDELQMAAAALRFAAISSLSRPQSRTGEA